MVKIKDLENTLNQLKKLNCEYNMTIGHIENDLSFQINEILESFLCLDDKELSLKNLFESNLTKYGLNNRQTELYYELLLKYLEKIYE